MTHLTKRPKRWTSVAKDWWGGTVSISGTSCVSSCSGLCACHTPTHVCVQYFSVCMSSSSVHIYHSPVCMDVSYSREPTTFRWRVWIEGIMRWKKGLYVLLLFICMCHTLVCVCLITPVYVCVDAVFFIWYVKPRFEAFWSGLLDPRWCWVFLDRWQADSNNCSVAQTASATP